MFNFLSFPEENNLHVLTLPGEQEKEIKTGDLTLSIFFINQQEGVFDLSMACIESVDSTYFLLSYHSDLFSRKAVLEMKTDFKSFLKPLVIDSNKKILELYESYCIYVPPFLLKQHEEKSGLMLQSNLTENQMLNWLGHKIKPNDPIYNNPNIYSIKGALSPENFIRAFNAMVKLSDSLQNTVTEIREYHK